MRVYPMNAAVIAIAPAISVAPTRASASMPIDSPWIASPDMIPSVMPKTVSE